MAGYHDITAYKGSAFRYHFKLEDETGVGISMTSAKMQVRRSKDTDELVLDFSTSGVSVFYNGPTGLTFSSFSTVGGISMNYYFSGATGETGGILVMAPSSIMGNAPNGNWVYDVLSTISGQDERIIQGRFICEQRVTT